MKKIIVISGLLALAMLLAACGGENTTSDTSSEAVSDTVSAESVPESDAESVPADIGGDLSAPWEESEAFSSAEARWPRIAVPPFCWRNSVRA